MDCWTEADDWQCFYGDTDCNQKEPRRNPEMELVVLTTGHQSLNFQLLVKLNDGEKEPEQTVGLETWRMSRSGLCV